MDMVQVEETSNRVDQRKTEQAREVNPVLAVMEKKLY